MSDDVPAHERYIVAGTKKLRCGFTTGTCAALASRAAVQSLLGGIVPQRVAVRTPKGWRAEAAVIADGALVPFAQGGTTFRCGVRKDAGDDPDVTDGCCVFATVRLTARAEGGVTVTVDGGAGVGRVTKAGLDQPVGAAAINRVPRQMITVAVAEACEAFAFAGEVAVTIDVPDGARLAARTFNPQVGITGGISIIGTSGVVEPMSEQALVDALAVEMRVIAAQYADASDRPLVITPGNYGTAVAARLPALAGMPVLKCANFVGSALDLAAAHGFTRVVLVGHAGKFVKLAGGIMQTHSRMADCRMELVCAHAAVCGADTETCARIMDCATVEAAFSVLDGCGLTEAVMQSLLSAARRHVARRVGGAYPFEVYLFTDGHGVFGGNGIPLRLAGQKDIVKA